jgi:phosphatidate phosphatase LPIN
MTCALARHTTHSPTHPGTITRSDLLGHVLPTLGVDWSHPGITQLFHNIAGNGYQIMFLSSRAIAQANITREYLHTLVQGGYRMPLGPVIISPHGLLPSLYRWDTSARRCCC